MEQDFENPFLAENQCFQLHSSTAWLNRFPLAKLVCADFFTSDFLLYQPPPFFFHPLNSLFFAYFCTTCWTSGILVKKKKLNDEMSYQWRGNIDFVLNGAYAQGKFLRKSVCAFCRVSLKLLRSQWRSILSYFYHCVTSPPLYMSFELITVSGPLRCSPCAVWNVGGQWIEPNRWQYGLDEHESCV